MSARTPHLLAPGRLGDIPIANRVVMSPMSRRDAADDGIPSAATAEHYRQRATAGLIVTGVVAVAAHGRGTPGAPCLYTEEQAEGWRAVTRAVHEAGGGLVVQLAHAGRLSHPTLQPDGRAPLAPSAVTPEGPVQTKAGWAPPVAPRALETAEIAAIVDDYRRAARLARQAGFDGVEIDAAGGKLIDQFLRPHTNRRADDYGRSIHNRLRFARDVLAAVTAILGSGRVGLRLSPVVPLKNSEFVLGGAEDIATFRALFEEAGRLDLAYLAVNERAGFDAAALREVYAAGSYIAGGGYSPDTAERAIAGGHAYAVGFAAAFVERADFVPQLRGESGDVPAAAHGFVVERPGRRPITVADGAVTL